MELIQRRRLCYLAAGVLLGIYMFFLASVAKAQDQGFIYGEVETIDGKTYKGQIRWGREETFWDDIFNSTKGKNPNLKFLERDDYDDVRNYRRESDSKWDFWSMWEDSYSGYTHSFALRFGDIDQIKITGRDDVELTFKNGMEMKFEGGSNDIGARINILDEEIGQIKIRWDRLEQVNFMDTPKRLPNKFGEPLYGTVETRIGDFTGLIQWDHEECLSIDKLDGDTDDGDVSIPMGNIASIEKESRGSLVTFRSGRELYVSGSNDVNDENRGVIVKNREYGKIKIDWDDFEKVRFDKPPVDSGPGYKDYPSPKELKGTVETIRGEKFSGKIVYDLDEEWDFELLNGHDDEIEFIIPFRNIKSVRPKNFNYSYVELRTGTKVMLGDGQDVSDKNDGLLVFQKPDRPVYIPWDEVEIVTFD